MTTSTSLGDRVHKPLLRIAGWLWISYLLSHLPFDPDVDFLRGAKGGCFVTPRVLGTCVAGAAVWTCLRVRRPGCFLAAGVSLPLAALCWWQLLYEQFPLPPR